VLEVVVLDEEEFGMNVFRSTCTGGSSIFAEGKSTHVVLIYNVGFDIITLGFDEIACPNDVR
jgi:hypothetical protein